MRRKLDDMANDYFVGELLAALLSEIETIYACLEHFWQSKLFVSMSLYRKRVSTYTPVVVEPLVLRDFTPSASQLAKQFIREHSQV